jgi:hypothetical protein
VLLVEPLSQIDESAARGAKRSRFFQKPCSDAAAVRALVFSVEPGVRVVHFDLAGREEDSAIHAWMNISPTPMQMAESATLNAGKPTSWPVRLCK